jgi:SAM-dependent methyltransferase
MMLVNRPRDMYDKGFFDSQFAGALESARVVAPLVYDLVHPRRVVDVGCARGAWLRAFYEIGADFIQGLDGDYVDRDTLLIPSESFVAADLAKLTKLPGDYDLAVCLEVLEHLSAQAGRNIVAALTEAAPVVLFSAAVPGQGGTNHVNEQWPEYWRRLFEARGYRMLDPIRPRIRDDKRVAWWYRQNVLMFASEKAICSNESLRAEDSGEPQPELEWVHVLMVHKDHSRNALVSAVSRALPVRLKRHLKRQIKTALALRHGPDHA